MEIWESARVEDRRHRNRLGRPGARRSDPSKPGDDPSGAPCRLHEPCRWRSRRSMSKSPRWKAWNNIRLKFGTADAGIRKVAVDRAARNLDRRTDDDPLLGFLRRSTLAAYESSRRLEEVARPANRAASDVSELWAGSAVGADRAVWSRRAMARESITRRLDGFDTHANQFGDACRALAQRVVGLDRGVPSSDLDASGHGDRVAVLGVQRVWPTGG